MMKAAFQYFKQCFMGGMQYRTAALAGIATQFFWGLMYLMIYLAFYQNLKSNTSFTYSQLVDYIWLQQAFLALIMAWFRDNEISALISSGNLAYELCRPTELYPFWYAKLVAKRLSSAMLRFLPIIGVALFIGEPYRLHFPASLAHFILFLASLCMGLLLMVALSILVYIATIRTLSITGALLLFSIVCDFLSGTLVPIPLMPDKIRYLAEWLPFRFTADFTFRIYSGHIDIHQAFVGIAAQVIWLMTIVYLGRLWMNSALKKIVVQGG